jgi:hypothetical protein
MALDLSKLADAVAKVADLAKSHADTSALVTAANAERDALRADIVQAQADVDGLTALLLAAATTPAEAAGLTAVADALSAPVIAPAPVFVEPFPVDAPVFIPAPVAFNPAAATYLPGDPRDPKNAK